MGTQRADMSLSVESGHHEEHSRPTSTTLDQIPPHSDSTPLNAKGDDEKKADSGFTEEKLQQLNDLDDWEDDPDNARNWSIGKKWVAVAIVCSPTSHRDSE